MYWCKHQAGQVADMCLQLLVVPNSTALLILHDSTVMVHALYTFLQQY
jgi:Na+/alanine symporter